MTEKSIPGTGYLYIAWVLVLAGTFGSLFFSEVLKFPPCALCWYQRISLYPLAVILPTGILLQDVKVRLYTLPFVLSGILIAGYHNLIYFGFISEALSPCVAGVSCSSKQLELFGFITIPLLSLASFILVFCLIEAFGRASRHPLET